MRRVLVPVDFSANSRAALRYALAIASGTDAEIHALHVVPPPSEVKRRAQAYLGLPISQVPAEVIAYAQGELDAMVSSLPQAGRVRPRVLPGDPASSVVQIADDEKFDLIIIGSRGRRVGGVVRAVMSCAHCPVLTLRPGL